MPVIAGEVAVGDICSATPAGMPDCLGRGDRGARHQRTHDDRHILDVDRACRAASTAPCEEPVVSP
jgi:hypothetical protein